jgi:hypothetical protein
MARGAFDVCVCVRAQEYALPFSDILLRVPNSVETRWAYYVWFLTVSAPAETLQALFRPEMLAALRQVHALGITWSHVQVSLRSAETRESWRRWQRALAAATVGDRECRAILNALPRVCETRTISFSALVGTARVLTKWFENQPQAGRVSAPSATAWHSLAMICARHGQWRDAVKRNTRVLPRSCCCIFFFCFDRPPRCILGRSNNLDGSRAVGECDCASRTAVGIRDGRDVRGLCRVHVGGWRIPKRVPHGRSRATLVLAMPHPRRLWRAVSRALFFILAASRWTPPATRRRRDSRPGLTDGVCVCHSLYPFAHFKWLAYVAAALRHGIAIIESGQSNPHTVVSAATARASWRRDMPSHLLALVGQPVFWRRLATWVRAMHAVTLARLAIDP